MADFHTNEKSFKVLNGYRDIKITGELVKLW